MKSSREDSPFASRVVGVSAESSINLRAAALKRGSSESAEARRFWFAIQISSAVTFASSVVPRLARNSRWMVWASWRSAHQPTLATSSASRSGTSQMCFPRVMRRSYVMHHGFQARPDLQFTLIEKRQLRHGAALQTAVFTLQSARTDQVHANIACQECSRCQHRD